MQEYFIASQNSKIRYHDIAGEKTPVTIPRFKTHEILSMYGGT